MFRIIRFLHTNKAIKRSSKVCIANTGESDLTKITVVPKLRNSGDKWPFQTEYQSYSQTIETLEAGKSGEVSFDFTARKNADAGRYTLSFDISAFGEEGEEVLNTSSFYVNIAAKEQQKPQTEEIKSPLPTGIRSDGGRIRKTLESAGKLWKVQTDF